MGFISALLLLLAGTAVQSMLPALPWLGDAVFPVLTALVLYYALYRGHAIMLTFALLAGLFQDSMSSMPLGYSSFVLAAGAMIIARYREVIMLRSAFTHMVLTALLSGVMAVALMTLMLNEGAIAWRPLWLMGKIPGTMLLGLITGPFVVAAAYSLEEKLDIIQGEPDRYGAQRTYYGIG